MTFNFISSGSRKQNIRFRRFSTSCRPPYMRPGSLSLSLVFLAVREETWFQPMVEKLEEVEIANLANRKGVSYLRSHTANLFLCTRLLGTTCFSSSEQASELAPVGFWLTITFCSLTCLAAKDFLDSWECLPQE